MSFRSAMVSAENHKLFSGGWNYPGGQVPQQRALVERVCERKKPFAHVIVIQHDDADLNRRLGLREGEIERLYNRARACGLEVSSISEEPWPGYYRGTRYTFMAAQSGTLADNFDMDSLADAYERAGLDEEARHIAMMHAVKLSSYFDAWDWQDDPEVKPWETGLILGYPIEMTMRGYGVSARRARYAVYGR